MTRGYVGDTQFAILPNIEAIHTMIITLIVQLVNRYKRTRPARLVTHGYKGYIACSATGLEKTKL